MAVKDRATLTSDVATAFPTNGARAITAALLRGQSVDEIDSQFNLTTDDSDDITEGSTNLFLTGAERTKLTGLSGTNTGDQTITLTGDVTGSGIGSFAATVLTATDSVQGKLQGDGGANFSITAGALDFSTNMKDLLSTFNGFFTEQPSILISESGGTVSLNLEKEGTGDLTMIFSDGFTLLDTTPVLQVSLTPGTDVSPTLNYVYIPLSTKVLTVSTSDFPSAEEILHIATVLVQSATSVGADGAYKVHAHFDAPQNDVNQGHESLTNKWIRFHQSIFVNGIGLTPTITTNGGSLDNLDIATAAGKVLQLHEHVFPAFDTAVTSDIYNINDPTTAFNKIQDLNVVEQDTAGLTLRSNNDYYNLVIWGVVSEGTGVSKLYVNSPTGKYGSANAAILDSDKTANYNIPDDFVGTGFLIARLTIRHQNASGGTLTVEQNEDLRGQIPSIFAGGTAATTTEFLDNAFRVQAFADPTKELALDLSGLTTGTTRTLVIPDGDGTLLLATGLAGGQTVSGGTASAEDLTLESTSNVTKGNINLSTLVIGSTGNVTGVNDLTVTGNLTINGTTTTVNTSTLSVEDPLIQLANNNSATDVVDIGIVGLYDTSGSQDLYCGLFRDATDGKFRLFIDSQEDLSTSATVNTGATGYTAASLVANLEGTVIGNVTGQVSDLSNHDTDDLSEGSTNKYASTANVDTAGAVMETDYNANTILAATSDDTPAALVVGEQTLVGRITSGNITALTPAQIRTLINVANGAEVNLTWQSAIRVTTTDYTEGSSTTLVLPVASPSDSEDNVRVSYNGIKQHASEWSVSGTTLTVSVIPVGVTEIELQVLA